MGAEIDVADVPYMTREFRERTIIVFAVCYPLAVLAVALRFLSRWISKNNFWWDDWLSVTALLMTTGFCATDLSYLPSDAILDGKQPIDLPLIIHGTKALYVGEIFYFVNQLALKFSMLFFYWRLFSSSHYMRVALRVTGCLTILCFIGSVLPAILQCIPVHAIWDPVVRAQPGVKCINMNSFFFGTSIPTIATDLVLVLLPVPQVFKLNITTAQKISVMIFFLLGGFVVIATIIRVRLSFLIDFPTFAINWPMDHSVVWVIVENCCGVISICLPSLRPVIKLLPWEFIQQGFGRSHGSNVSHTRTRTGDIGFNLSTHRSQWSEIVSTRTDGPTTLSGIRKEIRVDIDSIEMRPITGNSSQDKLAG